MTRLDVDEQPSAVLEPVVSVRADEAPMDWRPGDGPAVVGAPFLRLLDLPPLPGAEDDGRPVVAVAADPWAPMAVHGGEVWRLSGLLRGQQGSEEATVAGTLVGAVVVFLERDMARADVAAGERGLPRVWRAGPAGAPPGGVGFSEADFTWTGRAARPWRPVHLRAAVEGAGGGCRGRRACV